MAKQSDNAVIDLKAEVIKTEISSYDISLTAGKFTLQLPKDCDILTLVSKTFGTTLYVAAPVGSPIEEQEFYFIDDTGSIPDEFAYVLSFPLNPGKADLRQAAYHLYRAE